MIELEWVGREIRALVDAKTNLRFGALVAAPQGDITSIRRTFKTFLDEIGCTADFRIVTRDEFSAGLR